MGVIAMCHVQVSWVNHFFIVKWSVNSQVVLVPGTLVKASLCEGLRSIAASWASVRECRVIHFGKFTGELLT